MLAQERRSTQPIKTEWFGKQLSVLLSNGKSVTGELTEMTDRYIVLTRSGADTLVMVHAVVAVRLADSQSE